MATAQTLFIIDCFFFAIFLALIGMYLLGGKTYRSDDRHVEKNELWVWLA
jgi:hypothetical protein